MKILIVDDAKVMRNIHKNTLLDHGLTEGDIIEAGDGMSAIAKASENDIDLFIVDWNMPRLDGLQFIKKIRNMEKYKTTPVIMVTSEAAKYNVMEAIEAGVTNYIVKPIKEKTLWEKLSKYID